MNMTKERGRTVASIAFRWRKD